MASANKTTLSLPPEKISKLTIRQLFEPGDG